MSENNKGRFVQISNFRNIGVSEKPQLICINRSVNSDYIGNLVLLIGPNNSGKTNVLKALNILNEGISFKSTDLPYSISNPKEPTFIKLFEDIESMNVLLTKTADKRNDLPKITFSQ
ncbi:AAA family ATPase [bacterium]|nr:AAA family ATPase [bacterium]